MREERICEIKRTIERILDNTAETRIEEVKRKSLTKSQIEDLRVFYEVMEDGKKYNRGKKQAKSYGSFLQYMTNLRRFALWVGDKNFIDMGRKDVDGYVRYYKKKGLKTSNYIAHLLKVFFTWLYYYKGKTKELIPPKFVEDIRLRQPKRRDIDPNEVLTPKEIKKMICKADNLRDKALISILFESACRVSEITDMSIKDFRPDNSGAIIAVKGKTGKRSIRLIDSVPYITKLINNHPYKDNSDSPLFIRFSGGYGGSLTTQGVTHILKMIGNRADMKKRLNPHWFRHSGIDYLARKGFRERDLRIRAGWGKDSSMVNIYLHYDEDEVNNKYAEMKGIKIEDVETINELEPIKCPRCNKVNPADSLYCNCGMVLSMDVVKAEQLKKKADEFTNKLMKTPISKEADTSKGLLEALYQTMKNNPIMLEKFKEILYKEVSK